MKKTFILLFAMAAISQAAVTNFTDLSESITLGDISYDAATGKFTGDLTNASNDTQQPQTSVTMILDYDALKAAAANTKLIYYLGADGSTEAGLITSTNGGNQVIAGDWSGNAWKVSNYNCLVSDLEDFVFSADQIPDSKFVTVTFGMTQLGGYAGEGINLYAGTSDDPIHTYYSGLGTKNNKGELQFLAIDKDIVKAVSFNNTWRNQNNSLADAAAFQALAKEKMTPEPATATLSLLALAGLASRRRRH